MQAERGWRFRRLLSQGQRNNLIRDIWQYRLREAGDIVKFLEIWCPQCPQPDNLAIPPVRPVQSVHYTFQLSSLVNLG